MQFQRSQLLFILQKVPELLKIFRLTGTNKTQKIITFKIYYTVISQEKIQNWTYSIIIKPVNNLYTCRYIFCLRCCIKFSFLGGIKFTRIYLITGNSLYIYKFCNYFTIAILAWPFCRAHYWVASGVFCTSNQNRHATQAN